MGTTPISDVAGLVGHPAFLTVLQVVVPLAVVGITYAIGSAYLSFRSTRPDRSPVNPPSRTAATPFTKT
jgi:hypothetical protein